MVRANASRLATLAPRIAPGDKRRARRNVRYARALPALDTVAEGKFPVLVYEKAPSDVKISPEARLQPVVEIPNYLMMWGLAPEEGEEIFGKPSAAINKPSWGR
jgi:hypothetical protein